MQAHFFLKTRQRTDISEPESAFTLHTPDRAPGGVRIGAGALIQCLLRFDSLKICHIGRLSRICTRNVKREGLIGILTMQIQRVKKKLQNMLTLHQCEVVWN